MERFPAVVLGGPPHSGKSVLTYSLSQALRKRHVDHYVLRACPDGEGDWANEADQALVRRIRYKGPWTEQWIDRMCRDIDARHLPLIVDVGGRPTEDQERVFDHCTHAILLTREDDSSHPWRQRLARHGLPLLADLRSRLSGHSQLLESTPVIKGTITGLERGTQAEGPVFDTLVARLASLFAVDSSALRWSHLQSAPVELAIDLDRLAGTLGVTAAQGRFHWQPGDLLRVVDYLPPTVPLAAYGRGPNWLYAALAALAFPQPFFQFDVRMGWVRALQLPLGRDAQHPAVRFHVESGSHYTAINVALPTAYLDYEELQALVLPPVASTKGLLLEGKLPQWLATSLTISYQMVPWLAMYQPTLEGAVVVSSRSGTPAVGMLIPHPKER